MESVWYYVVNGVQTGPVSLTELKDAAAGGKLSPADLVWQEGTADWVAARTVAGVFPAAPPPPPPPAGPPQPTYSLSPPAPQPAAPDANTVTPLPLDGPEPLSLDDAPGRTPKPRRERDHEPNNPPAGTPEWVKLIPVLLRRALNPDPAQAAPVADEEATLTRAGVMDVTARKLAVWRRSVLFVAAVPCAFAALFGLIDVIAMSKEQKEFYSAFGLFLFYIRALAVFALPVTAIFGTLTYDRLSVSAKWVLAGGLVAFAVPLAVAFVPTDWLMDLKADGRETVAAVEGRRLMGGMRVGIEFYLLLVPLVFSLLPAVSRACVRLKLLLPESLVPGWGLVTSTPLFVLLALTTFVLLYHIAGNVLLLLGLLLWIGAPLLYLVRFNLLTRPVTSPADRAALAGTSLAVLIVMLVGILLLIVYLFTGKFGGVTILGFDEDKSIIRPWSLDLHRMWIEYLARSLFLTVFFADIILRVALSVWREERAFAGTADAAGFDRTMSGLGSATLSRGTTPVA